MERNYDEVIADMLIQLDQIDRRMKKAEERMEKFDKRMDLTIRRMVMAEKRLVDQDKRSIDQDKRSALITTKIELSIKDQVAANARLMKRMEQSEKLLINAIVKNKLKV